MSKIRSILKSLGLCAILYYVYNLLKVYEALSKRKKLIESYKDKNTPVRFQFKRSQTISEEQFQESLKSIKDKIKNDKDGLFYLAGPVVKKIMRGSYVFLGGGAAASLQLAHPYIATGVGDHSTVLQNPLGRFQRTFFFVFRIAYGDLKTCTDAAKTVRKIHNRIQGKIPEDAGAFPKEHTYTAADVDAVKWVFATLHETPMFLYEMIFNPISQEEKNEYARFMRETCLVYGLTPDDFPETYEEFQEYYFSVIHSNVLTVTEYGRKITEATLQPILWERYIPIVNTLKVMTSQLLPENIAEKFGIENSHGERIYAIAFLALFRSIYRLLPEKLTDLTAYAEREVRLEGKELGGIQKFASFLGSSFVNYSLKPRAPPKPSNEQKRQIPAN